MEPCLSFFKLRVTQAHNMVAFSLSGQIRCLCTNNMWVVQPLWQQGSSLKIWQHHSLCGVLLMWYTQVKTDYLYLTARWVLCWEVKCVAFVNTRGMPAIEHSLVVIRPQSGNQTKNFSTRACVVQFVTTTQKRFSHR